MDGGGDQASDRISDNFTHTHTYTHKWSEGSTPGAMQEKPTCHLGSTRSKDEFCLPAHHAGIGARSDDPPSGEGHGQLGSHVARARTMRAHHADYSRQTSSQVSHDTMWLVEIGTKSSEKKCAAKRTTRARVCGNVCTAG